MRDFGCNGKARGWQVIRQTFAVRGRRRAIIPQSVSTPRAFGMIVATEPTVLL